MLVHICCSVDSHYFLTRLKTDYPNEKLVGYFYNPNIHPYNEYLLRLADAKKSCNILNIELIEEEYDDNYWREYVKGLEDEPEKGKRCEKCFDMRFHKTAKLAKKLNHTKFTSTLLQSPLKNQTSVTHSAELSASEYEIEFVFVDYRSNGGMNAQNKAAKDASLYRQNYCGCNYGLLMQRKKQDKNISELFSPIYNIELPASATYRNKIFATNKQINTSSILNYRLLLAYIKVDNCSIECACLTYSISKKQQWRDSVKTSNNNLMIFEKECAKIITLEFYNKLAQTSYSSIKEFSKNQSFMQDLIVKSKLTNTDAIDISPVFVVNQLPQNTAIDFYLLSNYYEDREFFGI